jgi:hypothetical protein
MTRLLPFVLAFGCSQSSTAPMTARTVALLSGGCVHVHAHGAIPDDGIDDREALQAAIDAAQSGSGCLDIGVGKYHATRSPVSIASLHITAPLVIRGVGRDETTIAMLGSGTLPGASGPANWRLLELGGASVGSTISDLALDGSQRIETGEQTHLVQVTGPARSTTIERVKMTLPVIGPSAGGDCMRFLGEVDSWVSGINVRDVLAECDRSFIAIQRGVEDVVVERVETTSVGDQVIDFEPTGTLFGCTPSVRRVTVRNSILRRGQPLADGLVVAISGNGCSVTEHVDVIDSVVDGGGIHVIDAHDVYLGGLHVKSLGIPLLARKRIVRLRVVHSTLEKLPGGTAGPVVGVYHQSGVAPTDVSLIGVGLVTHDDYTPLDTQSLLSLVVAGSSIEFAGATGGYFYAVKARGIAGPSGAPVVVDSAVVGPVAGVATMAGLTDGGSPVVVRTMVTP